jgi:hypothetical protein
MFGGKKLDDGCTARSGDCAAPFPRPRFLVCGTNTRHAHQVRGPAHWEMFFSHGEHDAHTGASNSMKQLLLAHTYCGSRLHFGISKLGLATTTLTVTHTPRCF